MALFIYNHFKKYCFLIFIILIGCNLQEPSQNHGVLFLDNRVDKLTVSTSNMNDAINVLGEPHNKSVNDDKEWFYIERVLVKGSLHKLGKNVLKTNNVLILKFDKYGILENKVLLDKDDLEKVKFSKKQTDNVFTNKSFVEKFLNSVKSKMYSNRK